MRQAFHREPVPPEPFDASSRSRRGRVSSRAGCVCMRAVLLTVRQHDDCRRGARTLVHAAAPAAAASVSAGVAPPSLARSRRLLGHSGSFFAASGTACTLLGILGAHEMGHYLLCRRYNVDASPALLHPAAAAVFDRHARRGDPDPRAVPDPDGAVRHRRRRPDCRVRRRCCRRCSAGMTMSTRRAGRRSRRPRIRASRCCSARAVAGVRHRADGYTLNVHPMVFAAWFGMLATALNLLPFGQLDGGHITYATLGRWSTPISIVTVPRRGRDVLLLDQLAADDRHDGGHARSCSDRAIRACSTRTSRSAPAGRSSRSLALVC